MNLYKEFIIGIVELSSCLEKIKSIIYFVKTTALLVVMLSIVEYESFVA